jgi:hypothetical protein
MEPLIKVIPAKAGIDNLLIFIDSRLRGNDGNKLNQKSPRKISKYWVNIVIETQSTEVHQKKTYGPPEQIKSPLHQGMRKDRPTRRDQVPAELKTQTDRENDTYP